MNKSLLKRNFWQKPTVWTWVSRIALISFIIILSAWLYVLSFDTKTYLAIAWVVLIILLLWIGNRGISRLFDKYFDWRDYGVRRFFVQLVISLLFSSLCVNTTYALFRYFFTNNMGLQEQWIAMNMFGLLFILPILSINFAVYFLKAWQRSKLLSERLEKENIRSQLVSLRQHIDPHFLFNNLNVLHALIEVKPKFAQEFVRQFSDVYRYVLQNKQNEVVSLDDETTFAHAYVFLLQTRFGEGLQVEWAIEDKFYAYALPPLSLQLLLENACKHNIISPQKKLFVKIYTEEDYLIVRNNLQKKVSKHSMGTGLAHIKKRYEYLTEKPVLIIEGVDFFEARLPLLELEKH